MLFHQFLNYQTESHADHTVHSKRSTSLPGTITVVAFLAIVHQARGDCMIRTSAQCCDALAPFSKVEFHVEALSLLTTSHLSEFGGMFKFKGQLFQ